MLTDLATAKRVWTVLSVKPRKEKAAEDFIAREGFPVYCPRFKRRGESAAIRPLFPGYLFVKLSPLVELSKVCYFPGVTRPLLFGGLLACLEPGIVDRWKKREGGQGYLSPEPKPAFNVGQKVRFKEGAFTGLDGTVLENLPAKDRVRVLLEHLQMSVAVEVDRDALS